MSHGMTHSCTEKHNSIFKLVLGDQVLRRGLYWPQIIKGKTTHLAWLVLYWVSWSQCGRQFSPCSSKPSIHVRHLSGRPWQVAHWAEHWWHSETSSTEKQHKVQVTGGRGHSWLGLDVVNPVRTNWREWKQALKDLSRLRQTCVRFLHQRSRKLTHPKLMTRWLHIKHTLLYMEHLPR